MKKPPLRRIWLVVALAFLVVYIVAVFTVLPQWIVVSQGVSGADANTQLNAITTTRVALLGVLTPVVIAIGGLFAALSYRETVQHNRRTDALARRQRRADAYVELLSAWDECTVAEAAAYHWNLRDPEGLSRRETLLDKRVEMERAADRVSLLGSDEVETAAVALVRHTGLELTSNTVREPKPTDEERKRILAENNALYGAFLRAARSDLESTR